MKCGTYQRANLAMLATQAAHLERALAQTPHCATHGRFTYDCTACSAALSGKRKAAVERWMCRPAVPSSGSWESATGYYPGELAVRGSV